MRQKRANTTKIEKEFLLLIYLGIEKLKFEVGREVQRLS